MNGKEFAAKLQHPFSEAELRLIEHAYDFAAAAHQGQTRFSGEPYITHPAAAALLLAELFPNATAIAATLLHDVPEDTDKTLANVSEAFGPEIAHLVDGVTKLGSVRLRGSTEDIFVRNLRKMFLATSKDARVLVIKLADRLHNVRTLGHVLPEKQRRIAAETLEVYAPIANRLGIGEWKDELEDRSFKLVAPEEYQKVSQELESALGGSQQVITTLQKDLATVLRTEGVKFVEISGRVKRIYSLYKKLRKYEGEIGKIYDLFALRIITRSTADCYAALGAVHLHYQPLPGRVKDYIALPKPNGYRSIHTTVFDAEERIFEIQIRTMQMHEQAEKGIAAHWLYDESGKPKTAGSGAGAAAPQWNNQDLQWVKDLKTIEENAQNSEEFLNALKIDFFEDRIFVLTPKGDVKDLPDGATPIDFAFSVHTDLGFYIQGAKVNGKIVKLDHRLKSGDVVEVIKSKKQVAISRDWLQYARTSSAKSKIKHHLLERGIGLPRH